MQAPGILIERDELHISCPDLFAKRVHAFRLVRRAFSFPEVRSIRLQPGSGVATVRFQVANEERKGFLSALATSIGEPTEGLAEDRLPSWNASEAVTLFRFGDFISTFDISQTGPGRLQCGHPAIQADPGVGRRLASVAMEQPGVVQATATSSTGRLWISYRPEATDLHHLIRAAEAELGVPRTALVRLDSDEPAERNLSNATLGLATVGELAVPMVLPVCVGMLVVSNLGTIREAGRQLKQGKIGLPVLYTALLGCSITTGQIVAHALMEWSFRFWARQARKSLGEESRNLLQETLPVPSRARVVRSDEVDAQLPTDLLRAGHRLRVEGRESIPADCRVVAGAALIDQISVSGSRTAVRKGPGDEVFAGSTVLAGRLEMEVLRSGAHTRAARIARHLLEATRELPRDPNLRQKAQHLADRAVPPTMAAAGAGWLLGDLFTVGAILHQDHATGANLAIPLQSLSDMKHAMHQGVVVRRGDAVNRLGESRFVVLDDHPAWELSALELQNMESRLAESETHSLLRLAAGAGFYLGGERSAALSAACSGLGLVVRVPQLISLSQDTITVRQGQHTIHVRDEGDAEDEAMAPVTLAIDGQDVARLSFRRSALPRAALAVQRLRQMGIQVFVLSSRSEQETEARAGRLGADLHGGDFTPEQKVLFLQSLRKRGVRPIYVGNGRLDPAIAREAHVSISLDGTEALAGDVPDLIMLGDSLEPLIDMMAMGVSSHGRVRAASRRALLPNLLCVAGGFAGVLNGITAGLLANVGIFNVYRHATHSLRESAGYAGVGRART